MKTMKVICIVMGILFLSLSFLSAMFKEKEIMIGNLVMFGLFVMFYKLSSSADKNQTIL